MAKMAKLKIYMLLFQVFRTENTAYQSKFHVLGLRSYVLGLRFLRATPETVLGLVSGVLEFTSRP